jgi:hypothetical protein
MSLMSDALSSPPNNVFPETLAPLHFLLAHKNGFFAYDDALLFRPLSSVTQPLGIIQWNEHALWRYAYHRLRDNIIFFAEDIFGVQIGLTNSIVHSFDPESGDLQAIGTLDEWLHAVVAEPEINTGYPLSRAWREQNGPIGLGFRLLPKIPFILGGRYELSNLRESSDLEGMLFRSTLANQLGGVEDGRQVILRKRQEGATGD